MLEVTRGQARGALEKDLVYRHWNAWHGGVYVPVTEQTQPNPYLEHLPDRDITTIDGRKLTLINPAYMTRQVHELAAGEYGLRGHITSLNLLRPENAPDPWETEALKALERGQSEVNSVEKLDGQTYMRLMRPLIAEERCLKCHSHQGYKVGDIRGGVSVSAPMAPFWPVERAAIMPIALGHGALWLFGLGGLGLGVHSLKRRIRERERAERELRQSSERLRDAQRVAHMGSWDWNIVTNELHWSDEIYRIFGLSPQEFGATYDAFLASVHPDDRELVEEHVRAAIHDDAEYSIDHRIILPDGQVRHVHEQGETTRDANGRPVHMLGTVIDITKRKEAEKALRETEQRLHAIMDNTTAVVYLKDTQGRYLLVNRRFEDLFHLRADQIEGKTDHELFPAETADAFRANDRKVFEAGTTIEFEEDVVHDDGLHSYFSLKFPLYDTDGVSHVICGISTDITERKRAAEEARQHQEELAHVSRLSTMGEMASAIAHELNQPLAAILITAQACLRMMKAQKEDLAEICTGMEQVAVQARRAGEIIRRLKEFCSKRQIRRSTVDLNHLVREASSLMAADTRLSRIGVRLDLADNLPPVIGDTIQIEQVIVNLIRNAVEAMADMPGDECELVIQTSESGKSEVEVAVRDTGRGLPPDLPEGIDQVFEPFFTTKAEGMGIGLSISRSILEVYGGRLWATPNPQGGTTFRFTLPVVATDGG